jgi:FixJ family two-component response regulator
MSPTIHIVDDDGSFRTSVARFLEGSGFRVAAYASGDEILTAVHLDEPGCVLLDLMMPDVDGLELQKRLAEKAPHLPVLFLTGQGDIDAAVEAMKAGAEDFIEKLAPVERLVAAVSHALSRSEKRRAEHDRILSLQSLVATLTERESQVFGMVVRGKRNKQIAYEIGTSERTVKAHRQKIMEKLGARSLAEVVSIANELGLPNALVRNQPLPQ